MRARFDAVRRLRPIGPTLSGIEVLAVAAQAAKQTGVGLAVVAATRAVLRALEVSGVDTVLTLYATVDEAVDGAAPPAPQSSARPGPT